MWARGRHPRGRTTAFAAVLRKRCNRPATACLCSAACIHSGASITALLLLAKGTLSNTPSAPPPCPPLYYTGTRALHQYPEQGGSFPARGRGTHAHACTPVHVLSIQELQELQLLIAYPHSYHPQSAIMCTGCSHRRQMGRVYPERDSPILLVISHVSAPISG